MNRELIQRGLIASIKDAMQLTYLLNGITDTYNALCIALSEAEKDEKKKTEAVSESNKITQGDK